MSLNSIRKDEIKSLSDQLANKRDFWINKNKYFYKSDYDYMKFLIHKGQRVLDFGCGNGDLLNEVEPSYGLGIDLSEKMILLAKEKYSHLDFMQGDIENLEFINSLNSKFDVIILSDIIGFLDDCEKAFENLHCLCNEDTRIVIANYSWYWEPVLKIGEKLKLKMPSREMNWLSNEDTVGFLNLSDHEVVKQEWRQLIPIKILGLGPLINKSIAVLPIIQRFCLRNYIVARSKRIKKNKNLSATVIIPCRNEFGNIRNAVERIPNFCDQLEIIFVEGGSKDDTLNEIHKVIKLNPDKNIRVFIQDGVGKGDAVRKGFENAKGEVLMILDADLTVSPEDLPKFYNAINDGKGEYINGTRLIYPMDQQAMRFLNFIANRFFSVIFSWLLNQRITDTLCGTKVITKKNYLKLISNRKYFGDFDPFGDFDLILGSSKLNLKIIEVPIRYNAREYGETQISRFKHGFLLFRMVFFAFKKLKMI